MRVTALLCICLPVACLGGLYTAKNKKRAAFLRRIAEFFGALRLNTLGGGESLAQLIEAALRTARADPGFAREFRRYARSLPAGLAWEKAVTSAPNAALLTLQEAQQLRRFARCADQTSLAAFRQSCAAYEKTFDQAYRRAAQKCSDTEKLALTGASMGAALLFILLF